MGSTSDRPARVFLSYAYADRAHATRVAEALRSAGLRVWFDEWELHPGESITSRIDDAVQSSDALIVLLSPAAVNSRWVGAELDAFLAEQLRTRAVSLIPAIIQDCEVPAALAALQLVDLRKDFDAGIRRLHAAVLAIRRIDFSSLDPRRFESLVADLLRRIGFTVEAIPFRRDAGVDFVATLDTRDVFGRAQRETWYVEVKHYREERVSVSALRQMLGYVAAAGHAARGLVITSAQLTSVAEEFLSDAVSRSGYSLRVIDRTELTNLLIKYPKLVQKYFPAEAL